MNVEIIRSDRRTLAIQVKDGSIIVRAPHFATKKQIERFVAENKSWIEKKLREQAAEEKKLAAVVPLTEIEKKTLIANAKTDLARRAEHFAPIIGVQVNRITIRGQKTRWGSCSSGGNLNLNYLLMLAPEAVRDAVVVHELCHLKQMNHSSDFYREVLRVMPQYEETHKWLKIHGNELLRLL